MLYKRKVDANQAMIVKSLQLAGYHVTDLSRQGGGCPDLLCTKAGQCFLVEIKNPRHKKAYYTPVQIQYFQEVKAPVFVVKNVNDVELLIKGELSAINAPSKQTKSSAAQC